MADSNLPPYSEADHSENENDEIDEAGNIVKAITNAHPELLQGIPEEKKDQIAKVLSLGLSIMSEKIHSGPLPTVETLEGYDKIIPNGAERVMAMAEKEQAFRQEHTHYIAKRQFNQEGKGQWFAFILALIAICGALGLAYIGREIAGIAVIITAVAGLAGSFLYSKYLEGKKQNIEKED